MIVTDKSTRHFLRGDGILIRVTKTCVCWFTVDTLLTLSLDWSVCDLN